MNRLKCRTYIKALLLSLIINAYPVASSGEEVMINGVLYDTAHQLSFTMELQETATGGELIFAQINQPDSKFLTLQTSPGETAASVTARIAATIIEEDPFNWKGPNTYISDETFGLLTDGSPLEFSSPPESVYFAFAGTETGLGIFQPPKHVTAWYDPTSNTIMVNWENPPGGYDGISVKFDAERGGLKSLPGDATSVVIDVAETQAWLERQYIKVQGYNGSIPSNVGAIRLLWNDFLQMNSLEEGYNLPFSNGVLPNWEAWSTGVTSETALFMQVKKDQWQDMNEPANLVEFPNAKSLFQLIQPLTSDTVCGVFRKFIGLQSGRTYRVGVRVNTLELGAESDPWQLSLHAAYNPANGDDLTTAQLCGLAPLPDGSSGPSAGQFALYNNDMTSAQFDAYNINETVTTGTWAPRYTDDTGAPDRVINNVTLPAGVDTITVWLRHSGVDSSGVGLDWVYLENMTR